MKTQTRIASLSLLTILCLMLAVTPSMADTLYDNGPINGTTNAWDINFGYSVSDAAANTSKSNVLNAGIAVWVSPSDHVTSVHFDFGTTSFGTDIFSGVLMASGFTDLGTNQFGFDLQQVDFSVSNIPLPVGTSWMTLSNAVTPSGDPVYWDENSGIGCMSPGCPSLAYSNSVGSIPSEAFTLTGTIGGGTTPEPSSIMLFGSGILGLAVILRRRLMG
jgi:hypothetical protein